MEKLTNIIEAALFASGKEVSVKFLAEKLGMPLKDVQYSLRELSQKYSGDCGITLLNFNGKIQFATNPNYKEEVSRILNSIKEKEFTSTILECAAIIAYKQPITRGELEDIRKGRSSDYAMKTLLDMNMIAPCGKKDVPGHPTLYKTTDTFLKRFKIAELGELPDYETLLAQISNLDSAANATKGSYLYDREPYAEDEEGKVEEAEEVEIDLSEEEAE